MVAAYQDFSERALVIEIGKFDGNFCRHLKPVKWRRMAEVQFMLRGLSSGHWVLYWSAWQEGAKQ